MKAAVKQILVLERRLGLEQERFYLWSPDSERGEGLGSLTGVYREVCMWRARDEVAAGRGRR